MELDFVYFETETLSTHCWIAQDELNYYDYFLTIF